MQATCSNIKDSYWSPVPDFSFTIDWRRAHGSAKQQWQVAPQDLQGDPQRPEAAASRTSPVQPLFAARDRRSAWSATSARSRRSPPTSDRYSGPRLRVYRRNALITAYQYVIAKFDIDGIPHRHAETCRATVCLYLRQRHLGIRAQYRQEELLHLRRGLRQRGEDRAIHWGAS